MSRSLLPVEQYIAAVEQECFATELQKLHAKSPSGTLERKKEIFQRQWDHRPQERGF